MSGRRVNLSLNKLRRQNCEDGSAVRKIEISKETYEDQHAAKSIVSIQVRNNRVHSQNISVAYVIFLALICTVTLFLCLNYLKMKATLTTQNETIAFMESQLSDVKANNDAYYNQAMASISLENIKLAALKKFGMHYATELQIQYYDIIEKSHVR